MKSMNKVYKVKCRNPNCPNPNPDKMFEFKPEPIFIFRTPFRRRREYQDEILIATCPWDGWEKKIHVFKEDPDDKVY